MRAATLLVALAGSAAWGAAGAPGEAALRVKLPFPPGQTYKVMQGNRGTFSHSDEWNRFAWDFDMPLGSPITAVAAGTVVDVKEDSATGGRNKRFAADANYVEIDHGNGLFSVYMHVSPRTIRPRVGDLVRAGDVIARSGNNGWSTAPHLHFTITDFGGLSHPSQFVDFPLNGGIPRERQECKSGPVVRDERRVPSESTLPADAFARNGIRITSRLPGRLWRPRTQYRVAGRVEGKADKVVLFVMGHDGGDALKDYYGDVDRAGRFDFTFTLFVPQKRWEKNPHAFQVAMARVRPNGGYQSSVSVPITIYRDRD